MEPQQLLLELRGVEHKTDFVVSWYAKKYNKVIFRAGNMNHEGCDVWERDGNKYM